MLTVAWHERDTRSPVERPTAWLHEGETREQVAERLRPLLELPVEHVLVGHGGPAGRAALERALAA